MKRIIEKTGFMSPVVSINISVHLLQKLPLAQKQFRPSGVLKHGKLNFLNTIFAVTEKHLKTTQNL